MPNLFASRQGPQNTSHDPSVVANATATKDDAIAPVPEHYTGENNPYRGINTHGVPAVYDPRFIPNYTGREEDFNYAPDPKEIDPIPVKIVQEGGEEFKRFRVSRIPVDNTAPIQIVGRDMHRRKVTIVNVTGGNVWIGSDQSVTAWLGFPLGTSPLALDTHSAIYAIADPAASQQSLAILVEYSVTET